MTHCMLQDLCGPTGKGVKLLLNFREHVGGAAAVVVKANGSHFASGLLLHGRKRGRIRTGSVARGDETVLGLAGFA